MNPFIISGFADEICDDFKSQLDTIKELGMTHICLRSANGKNICEHTVEEVEDELLPLLNKYGMKVSSIGSPLGKVFINDDAAIAAQMETARKTVEMAHLLSCKYIRVFSFYIPEGDNPEAWRDKVMEKVSEMSKIFAEGNVIALHENEKDIYGDTAARCLDLVKTVNSPAFRCVFDFANFVQCREDVLGSYNMLKEYISYFHIKDYSTKTENNVLCGTGEGRISDILKLAYADGYSGFLTLEPHLVLFSALQSLELVEADEVIKENLYEDGRAGFSAQYNAISKIVSEII